MHEVNRNCITYSYCNVSPTNQQHFSISECLVNSAGLTSVFMPHFLEFNLKTLHAGWNLIAFLTVCKTHESLWEMEVFMLSWTHHLRLINSSRASITEPKSHVLDACKTFCLQLKHNYLHTIYSYQTSQI